MFVGTCPDSQQSLSAKRFGVLEWIYSTRSRRELQAGNLGHVRAEVTRDFNLQKILMYVFELEFW